MRNAKIDASETLARISSGDMRSAEVIGMTGGLRLGDAARYAYR
jgi:hypothetical protein